MEEGSAVTESEAIAELEAMLYLQLYHNTLGEETLAANMEHRGTAIKKPLPVFNDTVITAIQKNSIKSVPLGLEISCKNNPDRSVTKHVRKKTKVEESKASFIVKNVDSVGVKEEAKSPTDVLETGKRINFASSMPLVKQEIKVDMSTENTTLHLKCLKEKKVKLGKESKKKQMPLVKQEIEVNEDHLNNYTVKKDQNMINKTFKMPTEQQTGRMKETPVMGCLKIKKEVKENVEDCRKAEKAVRPKMPLVKQEFEIVQFHDDTNTTSCKNGGGILVKSVRNLSSGGRHSDLTTSLASLSKARRGHFTIDTQSNVSSQSKTVSSSKDSKATSATSQSSFDLEAELGIAQCSNNTDISVSGSSIDTVGAKPRKVKGGGKKSVSESIVMKPKSKTLAPGKPLPSKSLGKSTVDNTKRKGQGNFGSIRLDRPMSSTRNYKKSLGRLLTSSFGGQRKREVAEISSNSSDSEICDSDDTTSTEAASVAGTPSKTTGSLHHNSDMTGQSASKNASVSDSSDKSDNSESFNKIAGVQVIARATSKTHNKRFADTDSNSSDDILVYNVLGGKSVARSQASAALDCDLAWNVSSVDHDTIKTVDKQLLTEDNKDKWHVDEADSDRLVSRVSRYYALKQVRCYNCSKEGHLSTNCPEPRKLPNCFLCGFPGHRGYHCPNRHCFNCLQGGHMGKNCRQKRQDLRAICPRCKMKGHQEQGCPDHWRQYHATLPTCKSLVEIEKTINPKVYCCNCAKRGHFAFQCRNGRMDPYVFPTKPYVVRYDAQFSGCLGAYEGPSSTGGKYTKFNINNEDSGSPPKKICPEGSISHGSGKQLLPLDVLHPYHTVSQSPRSSSQAAVLPRGETQPLSSKSFTAGKSWTAGKPLSAGESWTAGKPLSAGESLSGKSLSSRSSSMLQPLLSEKKQSCKDTAKKDSEHRFKQEFVLQGETGAKVPNRTKRDFPTHAKSSKKRAQSKDHSDTSTTLTQHAKQFLHKQPKMGEQRKKKPISKGHTATNVESFVDTGDVLQKLTDSFSTNRQTLTKDEKTSLKLVIRQMKATQKQHIYQMKAIQREQRLQIRKHKKATILSAKIDKIGKQIDKAKELAAGLNVKKGKKRKFDPAKNLAKLSQLWQKQQVLLHEQLLLQPLGNSGDQPQHAQGESSRAQCAPKPALHQDPPARRDAVQDEANHTHDGISQHFYHRSHEVRNEEEMSRMNYMLYRSHDQREGGQWKDHRAHPNRRRCGQKTWQEQDGKSPYQYRRGDKQYSGWPKQHGASYSVYSESQSATQPHYGHRQHRYNWSDERTHTNSYPNHSSKPHTAEQSREKVVESPRGFRTKTASSRLHR